MQTILEPQQQISLSAVKVWRISDLITNIITLAILAVLLFLQSYYDWFHWIGLVLYIIIILVALNTVYEVFIEPIYRQRTWRYEINEEYIQLKHGLLHKHHLIVPMTKVQYVNTNQGPLLRRYSLSTITIGTMASSHEIPAISEKEAVTLRNRIAYLAKVNEDAE